MRMNCWRTTWGATLSNVGYAIIGLLLGNATGMSPIKLHFSEDVSSILFVFGFICKIVGTQWQGMAGADQMEVKKQLGLNPDGTPQNDSPGKHL